MAESLIIKRINFLKEKLKSIPGIEIKNDLVIIDSKDPLKDLTLKKYIKSLDVGFDENDCEKILTKDYDFMIIKILDKKDKSRILARIIGKKGKSKKNLSLKTNSKIIINDKEGELYLLGREDDLKILKESLEFLIEGKKHSHIYKWIDRKYRY